MTWTVFTLRVDPLERGSVVAWRILTQSVFTLTSHHALRWVGRLVESEERLETKIGLRADLVGAPGICSLVWPVIWGTQSLWNRALVRNLVDIDYKMPELVSEHLVMGSGLRSWSPTITLHVSLNLDVEAELMYPDSLKLPSCIRTPHVDSTISAVQKQKKMVSYNIAWTVFLKLHHYRFKDITKGTMIIDKTDADNKIYEIQQLRLFLGQGHQNDESEDDKSYDLSIKDAPLIVPMDEFQTEMRVTFEELCITKDIHRNIRVHSLITGGYAGPTT
ncbi:hypothetical protein M9H77_06386 [Catharanthus roseus]|uniref:Uncharacterized protein n=1 Tax=Catharanthus roseus TaxID=4058 RepID=A0ACC0BRX9_CATRO|nr:hypothetical protein M9H77_06386 [Catharanthus roseus]